MEGDQHSHGQSFFESSAGPSSVAHSSDRPPRRAPVDNEHWLGMRLVDNEQVAHSLAHGYPFDFALARHPLWNAEFLWIIDDGFDPKNETGFIIHFEPVLFNAMFDSGSLHAADETRQIRDNFTFKTAA